MKVPVKGDRAASRKDDVFAAKIELVEPTGRETLLHVRVGSTKWIVCAPGNGVQHPADEVQIAPHMGNAHFFDAKTGRSLKVRSVTP